MASTLPSKGQDSGLVVVVYMGTGNPVALARIDEKDRLALLGWLALLKEELAVQVMDSDDFNSCTSAAERLGLEHQVCRFHYLRWVNRLLNTLQKKLGDEQAEPLDEVCRLLQQLPPDGAQRIYQLYRQVKAPPRIYNQRMHPLNPPAKTVAPPER